MIGSTHRFHGHASLNNVYRRAQTVRGPLLSLKTAPREGHRKYRAAVVVSRKVHKSAVVRNRIRRRLYEVIRANQPSFVGPYDLVITVFGDQLAVLEQSQLEAALVGLLSKAGVIAPQSIDQSPDHGIVKPTGK